jgi:hypothetical protein
VAGAKNETDPRVLAAYDAMLAGVPGAVRKGAAFPYTAVNGNMYSQVSKANVIGIRLSKAELAAFLKTYSTTLYESFPGFFMKEYAAVPAALLEDVPALQSWFAKSHAHAASLKPKPTKR